jgi:hypothetical protein
MKTFAWISLVAAAVAAQNGIPSGVSDTCNTFLKSFNSDAKMQACIGPMVTATARFLPSANMQSNEADVKWAMDQLSSGKGACHDSDIQTLVTNFWAGCQNDLVSGNQKSLETTFELLYLLQPLTNAVTAKDNDGTYCLNKAKASGGHTKRGDDSQSTLQINPADWQKSQLHFLFANADASAAQLCTNCVKQVMTAYVTWENKMPYPPGLTASQLLSSQKGLWQSISNKCPADFTNGILTSANAAPADLNNAQLEGSTGSRTVISTTGLVGAIVALAAALA